MADACGIVLLLVVALLLGGAKKTLLEFANIMDAATKANSQLPPIAGSWDGGGSNYLVNALYLGLLPDGVRKQLPFFKLCTVRKMEGIPMFCYSSLFYMNSHFISGCNDAPHVMKRYSYHLVSGCRTVRMGAFLVSLTPMVAGGLALRALGCADIQSDKDAARRMNALYVPKNWQSPGIIVSQFLNALIVSGWTASTDFDLRQGLANVLTGYYLLLIMTCQAQNEGGKGWKDMFLPVQTVRNLLDLCAHFIMAALHWPKSIPWRPRSRQESVIEGTFGRIKSYSRGSPSVKDAIYGTYAMHASQIRQADVFQNLECQTEDPLTQCEFNQMASDALDNACCFQARLGRKKLGKLWVDRLGWIGGLVM